MIDTAIAVVVGAVVCATLWVAARSAFEAPSLVRTNYRGAPVVTSVGLMIPVTMVLLAGFSRIMLLLTRTAPAWDQLIGPAVAAATGFGLLGLLDDVAGEGQSGGFRGHLRELARGHLTSGMIKLVGGAALGVVVAQALARGDDTVVGALRDGAVVALAANTANLLDRAPGRAVKAAAVAFLGVALVSRSPTLAGPGVGVGAALGLLPDDLRERVMLGDAGANPLGALVGLGALSAFPGDLARWVLLGVLVALNLLSEVVSFSTVIERVPPLRWFDRLGRLPA